MQPTLVLKTFDPVSGVCLKYRTNKAAEVGRLVASLGQCGRVMAALPVKEQAKEHGADVDVGAVKEEGSGGGDSKAAAGDASGGVGGGSGGGGKKKKKGKR